jgi:hypothetical protein
MSPLWLVMVFLVLPLVALYVGLLVWSTKRDRWPR